MKNLKSYWSLNGFTTKIAIFVLALAGTFLISNGLSRSVTGQAIAQVNGVDICHATNSALNPYVMMNVPTDAIDGLGANDHSHHDGPVFDPSFHNQHNRGWGDIIPPTIPYNPGHNWDTAGINIWENDCEVPSPDDSVRIVAHKIVCEDEKLLPNMHRGPDIGPGFAEEWVEENDGCEFEEGWGFEWSFRGDYPGGDHIGSAGNNWNALGSTNEDGWATDWIDISNNPDRIEMREVLREGYLPFSDDRRDNYSAEMFCHTDVGGYDNWDWIRGLRDGETYYCVAWNVPTHYFVHTSKIICDAEEHLPNYGAGGPNMGPDTAQNYVDESDGHCWLSRWPFQWAPQTSNPGDNTGPAGDPWTGFHGIVALGLDDLGNSDRIWVREVFNDNYVEFSGANKTEDFSAELYCGNDVLNYDNFDYIRNPEIGEHYYCVAWNVEKPAMVHATKIVCDDEEYLPNWGAGGPQINSTTAEKYVAQYPENCKIVDWDFQWQAHPGTNPGDNTGEAGDPWTTFNGYFNVWPDTLKHNQVWVREVFNDDYIEFTGVNTTEDVSAEIYCDTDVLHYDNYEWVRDLENGEQYYCVAWNVLEAGEIQGRKFHDLNANGAFNRATEGGQNRLNGWLISLYDDEWNLLKQMETGDDGTEAGNVGRGQYRFVDLEPGSYFVCEEDREGWVQTLPNIGEQFEGDSTYCFTVDLGYGDRVTGLRFGNYEAVGQISGLVYNDTDNNSTQGVGDDGLENWNVILLTKNSPYTVQAIDQTSAGTGDYLFENLAFGTYYVCQDVQNGWLQTQLNNAGNGGATVASVSVGDVLDLDDAVVSNSCYVVVLDPSSPTSATNNFGNFFPVLGSSTTGQVLGTSTDGEVLAETGSPAWLPIAAGLVFVGGALAVGTRRNKVSYKV